jgi:PAS domain S-box-containing protein
MHLYYLPIILIAYFYRRRGIPVLIGLSLLYLTISILFLYPSTIEIESVVLRTGMFILIGVIVAELSERLENKKEDYRLAHENEKSIIDNANVWLTILDPKGKILVWNRAAETVSGYHADEVLGQTGIWKLMYPDKDYRRKITATITRIIHDKNYLENFETEVRTKEGSTRTISWNTRGLADEKGTVDRYVAIGLDITERKRAEEALRASEERYRAILEQAADAIFIHDDNGRILDVNQKACRNLGYSREELLSKSIGDIDPEAIQTEKDKLWSKVIAGGHFTFESRQKRKDGGTIPVEVSRGSVHLPDRLVIIGTARDITERKRAEDTIALTTRKLSLMNDVTYQFIQNKVTALSGYAELSKDVKTDVERLAFIEKEEHILADIYQLIKNSKDYQELGLTQLQWIPVEQSIRIAVSLVNPKQGISIEIHLHGLEVYADPLIEKIFYKLVDNAEKHGKTTTCITFSCHEISERLILTCENDGVGIPPERKARLFERGVGEKSGFDLFFSRECLALYGMRIAETGDPGKGARFEITVPKGAYRFAETGRRREGNR